MEYLVIYRNLLATLNVKFCKCKKLYILCILHIENEEVKKKCVLLLSSPLFSFLMNVLQKDLIRKSVSSICGFGFRDTRYNTSWVNWCVFYDSTNFFSVVRHLENLHYTERLSDRAPFSYGFSLNSKVGLRPQTNVCPNLIKMQQKNKLGFG